VGMILARAALGQRDSQLAASSTCPSQGYGAGERTRTVDIRHEDKLPLPGATRRHSRAGSRAHPPSLARDRGRCSEPIRGAGV